MNEEGGGPVGLLQFPLDILVRVFDCLVDGLDVLRCSLVCKAWQQAVRDRDTWPAVTFIKLPPFHPCLWNVVSWIGRSCKNLFDLDATKCMALPDSWLAQLAGLPLQRLNIAKCWNVRDTNILAAICRRRTLEVLDASDTSLCGSQDLAVALSPCAATLRELNLRRAPVGGAGQSGRVAADRALNWLLHDCKLLRTLDLQGVSWVSGTTISQGLHSCAANLRRLVLAECERVEDIHSLAPACVNIQHLDVSGTAVSDEDIAVFASNCAGLQFLNISSCMNVNGTCLQAVASAPAVTRHVLTHLDVSNLPRVPRHHLTQLITAFSTYPACCPLSLNLSCCGGMGPTSLLFLIPDDPPSTDPSPPPSASPPAPQPPTPPTTARLAPSPTTSVPGPCSQPATTAPAVCVDAVRGQNAEAEEEERLHLIQGGKVASSDVGCQKLDGAVLLGDSKTGIVGLQVDFDAQAGMPCVSHLWLRECCTLSAPSLSAVVSVGVLTRLQVLDIRHVDGFRNNNDVADVIQQVCRAASWHLQELLLDGCKLNDETWDVMAQHCKAIKSLSIVSCKGVTDKGLASLAKGCTNLTNLTLGAPSFTWMESRGLASGFTNLDTLKICRRSHCTDDKFRVVMETLPRLRALTLAAVGPLTDAGMAAIPVGLQTLTLHCVEGVKGETLSRLQGLRELEFSACPDVAAEAIQIVAMGCKRMERLVLPGHIPLHAVPVAVGPSHLNGILVQGRR